MDAAECRQDCREECFVDIQTRIVLDILLHFGTSSVVQKQVGIIVAYLHIASCIAQAVPREVVNEGHIDHQVVFPGDITLLRKLSELYGFRGLGLGL